MALGNNAVHAGTSEATLKDMDKQITWIHQELTIWSQQNKSKQIPAYTLFMLFYLFLGLE